MTKIEYNTYVLVKPTSFVFVEAKVVVAHGLRRPAGEGGSDWSKFLS